MLQSTGELPDISCFISQQTIYHIAETIMVIFHLPKHIISVLTDGDRLHNIVYITRSYKYFILALRVASINHFRRDSAQIPFAVPPHGVGEGFVHREGSLLRKRRLEERTISEQQNNQAALS